MDYIFGIYEMEMKSISEIIWASCDTLISGLIPLTFTITVNTFEEVLLKLASEKDNSVLTVCHLFDDLKNMSKHINSHWGIICLSWTFFNSTRHAFYLSDLSLDENHITVMAFIIFFVSMVLLLYFSGEVFRKLR